MFAILYLTLVKAWSESLFEKWLIYRMLVEGQVKEIFVGTIAVVDLNIYQEMNAFV